MEVISGCSLAKKTPSRVPLICSLYITNTGSLHRTKCVKLLSELGMCYRRAQMQNLQAKYGMVGYLIEPAFTSQPLLTVASTVLYFLPSASQPPAVSFAASTSPQFFLLSLCLPSALFVSIFSSFFVFLHTS